MPNEGLLVGGKNRKIVMRQTESVVVKIKDRGAATDKRLSARKNDDSTA